MTEAGHRPDGEGDNPEAATPPRGVSKAVSWDALLSTYLPAFLLAVGTGIVLPVIPALAQSFEVSFGVASGVVTVFLIGNVAAPLPGARAGGRSAGCSAWTPSASSRARCWAA